MAEAVVVVAVVVAVVGAVVVSAANLSQVQSPGVQLDLQAAQNLLFA